MRSPFHSETEAFRFLLLTVVAFAVIALASLVGGPWVGGPVCIAAPSAVRHGASDVNGGRARAQRRLDESLSLLRDAGIDAQGEIGDDDPLQAIEDALRTFGADEIVGATHREESATWLE